MALVETPALFDREPHQVHFIERQPQRPNGALEHRGEGQVEAISFLTQQAARGASLLDARRREVDIGPTGEPILAVPVGLAVAQKD